MSTNEYRSVTLTRSEYEALPNRLEDLEHAKQLREFEAGDNDEDREEWLGDERARLIYLFRSCEENEDPRRERLLAGHLSR